MVNKDFQNNCRHRWYR